MSRNGRFGHGANLTEREALLFEAGIKLGGIFHQYLGIPITSQTAQGLRRSIEAAVELQPFVTRAIIRIRPGRGGPVGRGRFAYRYLTPEMLDATVILRNGRTEVVARLAHRPNLHYPLMNVARVGLSRAKTQRRRG
jgi:hypothetical protein